MTTQIIKEEDNKNFTVTEFCAGKGKLKYQITQRYEEDDNHKDEFRHVFGFVKLSRDDLKYILAILDMKDLEEKTKL